jgi:hypothetical protein
MYCLSLGLEGSSSKCYRSVFEGVWHTSIARGGLGQGPTLSLMDLKCAKVLHTSRISIYAWTKNTTAAKFLIFKINVE